MGKQIERLKSDFVRKAPVGLHCDGGGLYLRVSEGANNTLNRSWVFRYAAIESDAERRDRKEHGGRQKERMMGLGPLDRVSLAEARKLAREKAAIRAAGDDPLAVLDAKKDVRRVERAAAEVAKVAEANRPAVPIFDRAMDAYYGANRSMWRSERHAVEWKHSLVRHVSPVIGGKRIDEIGVADIVATLRPIWKAIPVTAARVRARIERTLDHAYVHTYPDDVETAARLVAANPTRLNAHLRHLVGVNARTKQNFPALSYKEVGVFMAKLRADPSPVARALEFLILTAARSGMVIRATWDEVDLAEKTWTIPAARMKNDRNGNHDVPLSDRAIEILEEMRALHSADGRVFPVGRLQMWKLLKRLRPGVTPHGMRSCFKDWAGDVGEYPDELSELQLAHNVGDATRRAYRRGSALAKRRAMMQAWADFCGREFASNVVVIPAKVA
jgi:integrase